MDAITLTQGIPSSASSDQGGPAADALPYSQLDSNPLRGFLCVAWVPGPDVSMVAHGVLAVLEIQRRRDHLNNRDAN